LNDSATNSNDKSQLNDNQKEIEDKSVQYKEELKKLVTQSLQTSAILTAGQAQVAIKAQQLGNQRPELATFARHFSSQAPINLQGKALGQV